MLSELRKLPGILLNYKLLIFMSFIHSSIKSSSLLSDDDINNIHAYLKENKPCHMQN